MRKSRVIPVGVGLVAVAAGLSIWGIAAYRRWQVAQAEQAELDSLKARVEGCHRAFPSVGGNPIPAELALQEDPPAEALLLALGSEDAELQRVAAQTLGLMREPRARSALLAAIKRPRNQARPWCWWALGRIGERRDVEPLLVLLKRSTASILTEAASSNAPSVGDTMPHSLSPVHGVAVSPFGLTEMKLLEALGVVQDERAIPPLIERLFACRHEALGNARNACEGVLAQFGRRAVPALLAALPSADPHTQRSILWVLGEIGDPRAVKVLAECLDGLERRKTKRQREGSEMVHMMALLALVKIGTDEAMAEAALRITPEDIDGTGFHWALQKSLADRIGLDPRILKLVVRCRQDGALGCQFQSFDQLRAGSAVPILVGALKHEDDLAGPIAEALVQIGQPAVESLIEAVEHDPQCPTKVLWALGEIGDASCVEPLQKYLQTSDDRKQRAEALLALARLGDAEVVPIAREWLARSPRRDSTVQPAAEAIGWIGDTESIPRIVELATDRSLGNAWYEGKARISALEALERLEAPEAREAAAKIVAEALARGEISEPYAVLFRSAACLLVTMKATEAVPVLLEVAGGPIRAEAEGSSEHNDYRRWRVQIAAAEAIGELGGRECFEPLYKITRELFARERSTWNGALAIALVDALRKTGSADDFDACCGLLEAWGKRRIDRFCRPGQALPGIEASPTLGEAVARAVVATGGERALDPLVDALTAENFSARMGAAKALADLGDPRAVDPLVAAWELRRKKGREKHLTIIPGEHQVMAEALLRLDAERSVASIATWLNREDVMLADQQAATVRLLGQRKIASAAPALKQRLQCMFFHDSYTFDGSRRPEEIDREVRRMKSGGQCLPYELALAYGRCASEEAVPLLILALRSDNWHVQAGAAEALGEIGAPSAAGPLATALNHRIWGVREAAARSLGQLGQPGRVAGLWEAISDGNPNVRRAAEEALERLRQDADPEKTGREGERADASRP